jgi:catechol 2,3-dioxygenase-like lactoylglutathione lyase family enzyme
MLRRLDHLLVLTDDLDASERFYCTALGLTAGDRPDFPFAGRWLYLDDVPCVHLADRAEYEAHATGMGLRTGPAVDHVAFAASDFDALAAKLAAAGVDAIVNETPDGALRQLFVTDPNGVRIELNVPVPGT